MMTGCYICSFNGIYSNSMRLSCCVLVSIEPVGCMSEISSKKNEKVRESHIKKKSIEIY